jgi:hypothetical protein
VPFFFYIHHLYLIRLLARAAEEYTGYGWRLMIQHAVEIQLGDYGFSLLIVYLVWISVILALYPVCKMYDAYKTANRDKWWLSYL